MAFEGYAPEPYLCPAGILTQGFGHTAAAGPTEPDMGLRWSPEQAIAIFNRTFATYARRTATQLGAETMKTLNDNQFSALASFVYNTGSLFLANGRPSGVLRAVREGRHADVPTELRKWTRGGGRVLPGLVRRRDAEIALWNNDPRTAVRLAGPIPLIDSRGRVAGVAKLPSVTGTPGILVGGTPRAGEEAAPTATPPKASPDLVRDVTRNSARRNAPAMGGAAAAGASAPVATGAAGSDWTTVAVVAVIVLSVLAGALLWWLASVCEEADLRVATGTPPDAPLPPPEVDPAGPYAAGGPADPARTADNFV
jgi:lysozyme